MPPNYTQQEEIHLRTGGYCLQVQSAPLARHFDTQYTGKEQLASVFSETDAGDKTRCYCSHNRYAENPPNTISENSTVTFSRDMQISTFLGRVIKMLQYHCSVNRHCTHQYFDRLGHQMFDLQLNTVSFKPPCPKHVFVATS